MSSLEPEGEVTGLYHTRLGGGESIHVPQVTGRCAGWGWELGEPKAGGDWGHLGLEKGWSPACGLRGGTPARGKWGTQADWTPNPTSLYNKVCYKTQNLAGGGVGEREGGMLQDLVCQRRPSRCLTTLPSHRLHMHDLFFPS